VVAVSSSVLVSAVRWSVSFLRFLKSLTFSFILLKSLAVVPLRNHSYGGLGGADSSEYGQGLPELVHYGVGHASYLFFLVGHASPESVHVGCCVGALQLCFTFFQECGDAHGGCVEGGVQLSCYGYMYLYKVFLLDWWQQLVHVSAELFLCGGWCE
jgi:hypothetical protein